MKQFDVDTITAIDFQFKEIIKENQVDEAFLVARIGDSVVLFPNYQAVSAISLLCDDIREKAKKIENWAKYFDEALMVESIKKATDQINKEG